jgi:tetratricopeptide (TPR) repeat protein
MNVKLILLTAFLVCVPGGAVLAESPRTPGGPDSVDAYQQAIAAARDIREQASLHKKLGDLFSSREEYGKAADDFIIALSLAPQAFSEQERLTMAVTISWAGKYDDATKALRSILSEYPENKDARIHLAKVLSWSSNLTEAMAEADIVLKDHPDNQEALLVKANALRWQGNARTSIPVYEKALAQGDSFDVRLGLAYAYLETGQKERAQETGRTMKPLYPYQKKELERFSDALCGVRAVHAGIQYSLYRDSDDNKVKRYTLLSGFWVRDWETALTYRITEAADPVLREKAGDLWLRTHTREGRLGVNAGAGINSTDAGSFFIGQLGADLNMGGWTIGAGASRDALTDTAQLIQNRIVRTSGMINLTQTASPRLAFSESYARSGYSDDNASDDLQLGMRYSLMLSPTNAAAGYRFRHLNFRRQSGGGYFDPEHFSSHQVFVSLSREWDSIYAALEPYIGYQSYKRYGEKTSGFIAGFSGAAGWRLKKCTSFELTAEGGNDASGTAAGFNYFQIGFRFIAYF